MAETNRMWMRAQWRIHKLVWNLSGGRVGREVGGMPVLELISVGHRSGLERQILITYVADPTGPLVVGTNAGRDADPAWVRNVRATPGVRARWGGQWHDVTAVELVGDAHEAAWTKAVATNAKYADYAADLTRHVPIIRLEPR